MTFAAVFRSEMTSGHSSRNFSTAFCHWLETTHRPCTESLSAVPLLNTHWPLQCWRSRAFGVHFECFWERLHLIVHAFLTHPINILQTLSTSLLTPHSILRAYEMEDLLARQIRGLIALFSSRALVYLIDLNALKHQPQWSQRCGESYITHINASSFRHSPCEETLRPLSIDYNSDDTLGLF